MNHPDHIEAAIDRANTLENLLRIMSMAIEAEQISATSFADNGGGSLIDMAISMAREIINGLDVVQ
ncbi:MULTISPECIES: hypothetical protein [unclassified Sulfitobacter]|uniref:hypothetical protein n=1 Tax=unclassified Sulfitobacter TaxID=196795 RepID=UPI0007C23558|nr:MULTISPECIES: hypothetical protein [unclassified Sulfitobacter]KZX95341.1 hypothetical protein A3720_20995 [Sulfitobacter sp. HI0021]KZY03617.1 hypothetical protein A3722_20485 [Sulfitobacter sp. HI0027]KZZ02347.1 hypothetical protein A3747_15820 [Sulfitobacter sp. HI0076]